MATCHMIIAIITARDQNSWPSHRAAGWAAVAMVWLFVVHVSNFRKNMEDGMAKTL